MDGSYDNNKNFQFLSFKEILPAIIKVRNDWSCKKYQSSRQKQGCKKYRKINYRNAGKNGTIVSEMDDRRNCLLLYQKNVRTICFRYSIWEYLKEIILKVSLYNLFIRSISVTWLLIIDRKWWLFRWVVQQSSKNILSSK